VAAFTPSDVLHNGIWMPCRWHRLEVRQERGRTDRRRLSRLPKSVFPTFGRFLLLGLFTAHDPAP
jgi:hypothetical protein